MTTVTLKKRDMEVKAKRLRREGYVPGIVCGKEMKESLPVIIDMPQAERLMKADRKGNRVSLDVDGKTMDAIIKDWAYDALKKQVVFIDFQALVAGEKIHTTAPIVIKNEQLAKGCLNQELEEIAYKAEPAYLIDEIVIDFDKLGDVRCVRVEDLEINNDKNIDILTSQDAVILTVDAASEVPETDEEADATEEVTE